MEEIKTIPNVEFDVIYADGTRHHVAEGVLFGVENETMTFHNGTDRAEVVFAASLAIAEIINATGAPRKLKIDHIKRVFKRIMGKKGGRRNGV